MSAYGTGTYSYAHMQSKNKQADIGQSYEDTEKRHSCDGDGLLP